jgi:hypothetical protein
MTSRKSPAQIKAELRRAQQKARQAVNNYNREVDKYNAARRRAISDYNAGARKVNQAIDRYNRDARAHNARVRANRGRLERELRSLQSQRTTVVRVEYRASVSTLAQSFSRLEAQADTAAWAGTDVLDYSETEAANSVAALNALLDDTPSADATDEELEELQRTDVDHELGDLNADLGARWRGALFALHPRNPDAARHFCTSAREMLSDMLEIVAPSNLVESDDPACERTEQGAVSRRARIRFCLRRSGIYERELEDFIEQDVSNVLALFREFNTGTHGAAGRFTLAQLTTLKARAEDAIRFIVRIAA